jgi:hypothetical protein
MASGHVQLHQQAEHMAAPTSKCDVKISLGIGRSQPPTHGTKRNCLAHMSFPELRATGRTINRATTAALVQVFGRRQ